MLDLLGLDAVAESVYRGLLNHPHDDVGSLRSRLGLSEEEFRSALELLTELALVRSSTGDGPWRLHAMNPRLGMEILLARQQAELAAHQQRVEAGRAAAARLISEFAACHPGAAESSMIHLDGVDRVRDYLARIHREVQEEVLAFAPGGAQTVENMQASRPLNQELLERGVRMRTVYLDSIRNHRPTTEHAQWLMSLGAEVRTIPSLATRMIISDRRVALLAADSHDTSAGALVLGGEGLLTALCSLFETVWEAAEPLGPLERRSTDQLNRQQQEALRLLAQGYTDEAIAKRLGVSSRTARRIATDLMERLHARSRFQAGVHAVQQGCLPNPSGS
ncbi:helix-turn-helix domain-containing protein [Streptomyces sp. TP-A0874]|uniref:helix-turn-helix domain-containing protein n=1 Tax=Streptomyces sp. TP-A0874 TaxID=549819 RepID=UPI000852D77B|nr:helix-turn-helix transcriptional regulator [Streptomyces sp. TP-A0874]